MQYLGAASKTTEWLWFVSRHTIQHHSNPSLCPNHWCWRSWHWLVLWRPTKSSRNNTMKKCSFPHRMLECRCRKSRDTWNNRQVWPWSTKLSRPEANKVLSKEHANILFQQPKRRLYIWTSANGQYQNQSDYVICSWRWRSSIQSAKTRPGADCGSDHELFIAKFRI